MDQERIEIPSQNNAQKVTEMLKVNDLTQFYGGTQILWDVNLQIAPNTCTCIIGRNGVGKTTFLKCLMGLLPITAGEITFNGEYIHKMSTEKRVSAGIAYVPQGRDIFPKLTVEENLKIGLTTRKISSNQPRKFPTFRSPKVIPEKIFALFPALKDMLQRQGGDLSGGQQQQLAIARALILEPKLLILDEPNEGIQPNIVKQIGAVIKQLNESENLTVLLVEQKLGFARWVGNHFHLLEKGRVVASDIMQNLTDDLVQRYLAV